jgi:hypothetical protein
MLVSPLSSAPVPDDFAWVRDSVNLQVDFVKHPMERRMKRETPRSAIGYYSGRLRK